MWNVNKMNKLLLLLASLAMTQAYAKCGVTYAERDYQLDSGSNDFDIKYTNSYNKSYIGANILNDCQKNTALIYANAEFAVNSSVLSGDSPFQLTDAITLENSSALVSANDIQAAKEFLKNNVTLTFALQDNADTNTPRFIEKNTTYSIIPATTAYPTHRYLYVGRYYYTGAEQNGIRSLGIRFVNPTISIKDNSFLKPAVIRGLNGSRLNINTGKLTIRYFYPNEKVDYIQDTNLILTVGFQVKTPTCNLDVPNTLNLGSTTKTLLNNGGQNKTNFNLNIICSTAMPQTQFSLKVIDSNDLTNMNSNGTLTNVVDTNLKSNAVIQLINNQSNQPFEIGKGFPYLLTDIDDSRTVIQNSASAQIIKSQENITVGQIESKVTFLLDYE